MKIFRFLALVAGAFALAGCDSDKANLDDFVINIPPADPFGLVQFVHAVADAPTVDIVVDGVTVLSGVDYKAISGSLTFSPGTRSVQVLANLPDGTQIPVVDADVVVVEDSLVSVAVVGTVLDGIAPALLTQALGSPAAGNARVAVIHATPGPGGGSLPVTVYVTDPAVEDLMGVTPLGTFDFGETLGPVDILAGDYRIRVLTVVEGDALGEMVYDSGTVTLNDGDSVRLAAVPNINGGPAALTLLAFNLGGGDEILDVRTPAWVRIGHLSPDAPPVDVVVDDEILLDNMPFLAIAPPFPDLFGSPQGFGDADPGSYDVRIETADNATIVLPSDGTPITLDLAAGSVTQVLAVNTLASIELLVSTDFPRPVATGANVRVIHAASNEAAGEVDLYVVPSEDMAIMDGAVVEGTDPLVAGFAFKDNSGYQYVAEGIYDVCVTVVDTLDCAILELGLEIPAGLVGTAIAVDDGEGGFGLLLLEDFPLQYEQPL